MVERIYTGWLKPIQVANALVLHAPLSLASIALALAISGPALAQAGAVGTSQDTTQAQGGIQEIVVTAQRREQSLQDVGVSVSAISADSLRNLSITDARDISKAVPGVLLTGFSGGQANANLTLRGISQGDFTALQESPNSTYIDDVYISSPFATAFNLYDIARVEVLRGPQGTLFGRASSGGLANFITNRPTQDWQGYAETGYSSYNDAYGEGAISGPISDRVRFRVASRIERANGWFENGLPGGKPTYEKRFVGVRGQLEADITDRLNGRLSVSYDDDPKHNEGMYRDVPYYYVNGQPAPLPADVNYWGTCPGCDQVGYRNTYTQWNKQDFLNYGVMTNTRLSPTLYVTYHLDNATFSSITNYTKFHMTYRENTNGGPVLDFVDGGGQDLDQYSQELRVNGNSGNLTYTGGFYYLHTNQSVPFFAQYPALSGTPFGFNSIDYMRQKLSSYAPFGQLEYQLTPTLTGIIGARYSYDVKVFDSKTYFNELGSFYGGPGVLSPPLLIYDFSKATVGEFARHSQGLWSGKVGLNYKPGPDTLLYASVSRGVKAAGFNSNAYGTLTIANTPFKSEFVDAYEVGSKLRLFDHRLRFNTSAFYYNYHRFQGFSFNSLESIVNNYDGHFAGGEVELNAAPRRDIDLTLGASYLHTELYHVLTNYGGFQNQQSIMAPKWTFNGVVTKRFEIPVGTLALSWDGNYIGDRYNSVDNNAANFVPGSFIQNARVTSTSGIRACNWRSS